jgi:ubiquitin-activating enzyme E1
MTLKGLIEHFKTKHELEITMLSAGPCVLYTFFMPKKKVEERMEQK